MGTQAGTIRNSILGDLSVVVNTGGLVFTQTEFIDFTLINRINEPPFGFFRVFDLNSHFMKSMSSIYGSFVFTDTSDGLAKKTSGFNFYVTDMKNEEVQAGSSKYLINWTAGIPDYNKKITHAYTGNSTKVMEEIFAKANASNNIKFPTESSPADDMTWITPHSNMWEQLDAVVNKSFRPNDYIFWAWDDVNSTFKISSFEVEKNLPTKYMIVESEQAIGSTKDVKDVYNDGSLTIWRFDNATMMNTLGSDRKKLFPNVSFSGIVGENMESTGFRQDTFATILEEYAHDDKIKQINALEPEGSAITYGDLVLKRQWPNNTHKLYSFSDVYRDYKLATYAKRVDVQIYNNMGPPIGSKVVFLKMDDARRSGYPGVNKVFSDRYIIIEKVLQYNPTTPNITSGQETVASANFIMKLTLVSDNFTIDTKETEEIIDESMKKVNK